jgi:diguanylate cyclase (GGDEF)-like protein
MKPQKGWATVWKLLVVAVFVTLTFLLTISGRSSSIQTKPLLRLDGQWYFETDLISGTLAVGERPDKQGYSQKTQSWVVYSTNLPSQYDDPHSLIFRDLSHRTTVSIDGKEIYSFGHSPQYHEAIPVGAYHIMAIPPDSHGKKLTIRFESFGSVLPVAKVPEVIIGQGYTLLARTIVKNAPMILLGLLILIMGLFLSIFGLVTLSRPVSNEGIVFFGVFAMLVGTWSILSTDIPQLLWGNHQGMMIIKISCFMLCAVPFEMFIMHVFNPKRAWLYRVLSVITLCQYIVAVVTTVVIPGSLHAMLYATHAIIAVTCIAIIWTMINAVREKTMRDAPWFLGSFSVLVLGIAVDFFNYYRDPSPNNNRYFVLAMFIFSIITGWRTFGRLIESYMQGVNAELYEKIAFNDILTGLPNRTAFEKKLDELRLDVQKCSNAVIVMLDLDHLKQINDTFGHRAGDGSLRKIASLIQEVYGKVGGICYRIGGDEFVVLLDERGAKQVTALSSELHSKIEKLNTSSIIPLSVSLGYAVGSMADVSDPYLIFERADAMMYRCKQQGK